jgi:GTPase SAR1 family protein
MTRFIQLIIGPAGVGKSTYCKVMQDHGKTTKRTIFVGNLDPAAEVYDYEPCFDIRDLISLDQVMEESGLGPNGGLVYCMEYLLDHLNDTFGLKQKGYDQIFTKEWIARSVFELNEFLKSH